MLKFCCNLIPKRNDNKKGKEKSSPNSPSGIRQYGLQILYTPKNGNPKVDVVCIHGLNGDREKTWTSASGVFWIKDLLPSVFPHARIFTFGYDARPFDVCSMISKSRIGNHAKGLVHAISDIRVQDDEPLPIIFIAHSLGGLVCKDALLYSRNSSFDPDLGSIVKSTLGIAFLGTPHSGSDLAKQAERWCKFFGVFKSATTEILQVLKRESEVSARIQTDFLTMLRTITKDRPIDITCFFEEIPFLGLGCIVPASSAILPAYPELGIHANHRDIARYETEEDPGFVAICGELRRWMKVLEPAKSFKQDHIFDGCPLIFEIPHTRHVHFIGRQTILDTLETSLQTEKIVALSGIGGVGKSEIAIEFCYRFQSQVPEGNVFWIQADSAFKFQQAYTVMAQMLGLQFDQTAGSDTILELVKRYLSRTDIRPYVMVIDSADNLDAMCPRRRASQNYVGTENTSSARKLSETSSCFSDASTYVEHTSQSQPLMSYIPNSPVGKVIVTTRNRHVGQVLMGWKEPIQVESLSPDDAKLMFYSAFPDESKQAVLDEAMANRILEILDFLPLAITHAMAYIRRNKISLEQYHLELTESETALHGHLSEDQFDSRKGFQSVIMSLKLSFDDIRRKNADAADLLSLASLLNRERIPRSVFCQIGWSQTQLTSALGTLKNYSLIKDDKGALTFSMHRLVQLATSFWIGLDGSKPQFQQRALKMVADKFPCPEERDSDLLNLLIPHARVVEKYKSAEKESQEIVSKLQFGMAWHYKERGLLKEADEICKETFRTHVNLYGRESISTLRISDLLGGIARKQGFHEHALAIHEENLKHKESLLGKNDLDTIRSVLEMAHDQFDCGRLVESVGLYERVFELYSKELGPEHLETISTMADIAWVKALLKQLDEAEDLAEKAYAVSKRALGEDNSQTLDCGSILATVHRHSGHFAKAVELNTTVWELRKATFGEKHPFTLANYNDLALAYIGHGDFKKAAGILRYVNKSHIETLGLENPETIMTTWSLAKALTELGELEEAIILSSSSLQQGIALRGKEHPFTLMHKVTHARLLNKAKNHDEALELAETTLEASKRVLGDTNCMLFNSMCVLASVLHRKGNLDRAEGLFQEALEGRSRLSRKNHPDTLENHFDLGLVYEDNLKFEEALQQFKICWEGSVEEYGRGHKLSLNRFRKMKSLEKRLDSEYRLSLTRGSQVNKIE